MNQTVFPLTGITLRRLCLGLPLLALLAACDEPLDYDLRGKIGAFSTAPAAQQATDRRPRPDARGVISYPNYQVAVARRDDTVAQVAGRVGLPVDEVARFNGLTSGDKLREGEVLALPRRVAEPANSGGGVDIASLAGGAIDASAPTTPSGSSVQTTTLAPASSAGAAAIAAEPVRHKVSRGETAYTVARLYDVPVKSLAEWNGLGPEFSIREGQYLLIPVAGANAPARTSPLSATSVTAPGAGSPTPLPPSAAKPLPTEKVAPRTEEIPQVVVDKPSIDTSKSAAMAFPVKGKIIRAYSKGRNEGIDIAAAPGTAVTAAAAGSVAAITSSSGDQVPIVVVRHADNLLTVYANVDNIQVKKGDPIKRGQKLAQLRTGDNAYVHFEVRNGFDSVNPLPYLE